LYTYVSSAQSYETVQPNQVLLSGMGFWVYFATPTTVVLGVGSTAPTSAGIIPGQWVLLGDPSGTKPAVINQDAIAYTYDPLNGDQPLTSLKSPGGLLLPGKGVWVTLAEGSHMAPTIMPNPLFPDLTSFSLTSPCAGALATQGYLGEGNGEPVGDVDGQPVRLCRASGPSGLLPATNGIDCLLVGDRLTTLDGGPACGLMERVVQQGATLFLVVGHVSATQESIGPLTWDGIGFQSNPANAYIACPSDIALPVASAAQCTTPSAVPPSAPTLPVITLPVQSCPGFPPARTSSTTAVSVKVPSGGAQVAASLRAWGVSPNVLLGPADFTCMAAYGSADGGLVMTLSGADDACALQPSSSCDYYAGPIAPTDRILAIFSPGGSVSPIILACPYFTSAQAGLQALPNTESIQSSCASLPPGQAVQQLDANSVAFYQPADNAHPSPTFGIVVSDVAASGSGTTGASTEATCTLPATSASVCQFVLIVFLTGWGQQYDPAANSAATALAALPWFVPPMDSLRAHP
jgi:hypothetical protein